MYDIAGIQSGNLGAVANPHRTIKYIVIRAQRYSHYTLSDLRLHNIVVSEGLSTVSAPMYADATNEGRITPNDETTADVDLTQAMQSLSIYWTGWWPLLHVVMVYEFLHPETTITIETHEARNIAGVQEFSACSVSGDASVLEASSEEDENLGTLIETIGLTALATLIAIAGGVLEWAIRLPPPSTIAVTAASAALSALALIAVIVPSWFAYKMVHQGDWTRNDAGRYLFELAYAWLGAGFSGLLTFALTGGGASAGVLSAIAGAAAALSVLKTVLQYSLFTFITMYLIGVALFEGAKIWFYG